MSEAATHSRRPAGPTRGRRPLVLLSAALLALAVTGGSVSIITELTTSVQHRDAAATAMGAAGSGAGRHFVVVSGGGDTSYLAVGTTTMTVPAGSLVTFDAQRLTTSLVGECPRWDLMARFGGRSVGDTRVTAGTWTQGPALLGGAAEYLALRPEPMTWSVACYDDDGGPMSLPPFTAHIEFLTATPLS